MLSRCSAEVTNEGGFELDDSVGGAVSRKSEDEEGDDRRGPGWWNSWPSACWGDSISVAMVWLWSAAQLMGK